ncbi:MAG: hypothetical protein ACUVR4_09735 [Anaerolineae bacterium]
MRSLSPVGMMIVGFCLLVVGFIIPFLMIIQIIKPGFFLAFFSYAASLSGLFLGLIGAALYARERRQ